MAAEENPYASPESEAAIRRRPPPPSLSLFSLIPLWTWCLVTATVGYFAMLSRHGWPIVMMLICFGSMCIGAFLASSIHKLARWAVVLLLGLILLWPLLTLEPSFMVQFCVLAALNVAMGSWSWRSLPDGRSPIFACFGVGLILGTVVNFIISPSSPYLTVMPIAIYGSLLGYLVAKTQPSQQSA